MHLRGAREENGYNAIAKILDCGDRIQIGKKWMDSRVIQETESRGLGGMGTRREEFQMRITLQYEFADDEQDVHSV